MLQFTDQHGTRWEVYQVSSDTLSTARSDLLPMAFRHGWLVFDCGTERRRLAPFPSEWAAFSGIALESLLDAAERVAGRQRLYPAALTPTHENKGPPSDGPLPRQ